MKTAIVHYWLVHRRGGEKVLDGIAELLPDAALYAHVIDPALLTGALAGRATHETWISRLPLARKHYAAYLPLMPLALEMLDMGGIELIVSSEAGPAKWIIPDPDALHICYCHSPLRYIWDQRGVYLSRFRGPVRWAAEAYASGLRRQDADSALRVDKFVANSTYVAQRIWKYYRREAVVVHPPVDVASFRPAHSPDDYYLLAGELRGYKGAALAVEACRDLDRPLIVAGGGDAESLKRLAGRRTQFVGRVSDERLRELMAHCRALLFPGVEDFGIVPVEVMASGRPVIALARGGAMDSVVHEVTGILYPDPTLDGLKRAITVFEADPDAFRPEACVAQAARFSRTVFRERFAEQLPPGAVANPPPGGPVEPPA